MKTTIIFILLLTTFQICKAGSLEMEWSTSLGKSAPSCALYRKRVANYYQRISEVEKAERSLVGALTNVEISRMIELWQRTGVPLLTSSTATFKTTLVLGEMAKQITDSPLAVSVNVVSDLFNWEADSFIFPEDVFKVVVDKEAESLQVEVIMPFAQACLRSTDVFLTLNYTGPNGEKQEAALEFNMDKTEWEKGF